MAVLYIRNSSGEFEKVQSLNGKTAYQAAKEGGYTGTESEFNTKLAQPEYTLPTATESKLGGVKPVTKSSNMTRAVGVDENGALWTTPSDLFTTIENYYAMRRTGKIYQTKLPKFVTNPTSAGEKLLDNKNLVFVPSTDTEEGQDDYLNGTNPLFEWVNVNYKRYDDGTAYPVAIEGMAEYSTSGNVDVGTMQMEFYYNVVDTDDGYQLWTISDSPNEEYGLKPWVEGVRADGTVLPWCIGSKYMSGIGSDGLLHSQPNLPCENFQSHNNMLTNYQKKGKGYYGAGSERNTFQIIFNVIKGNTKNSQSLYQGCVSYNYQYTPSVKSSELHNYITLTTTQANNLIVGSGVYVGYSSAYSSGTTLNIDRGQNTMRAYTPKIAKITKIEAIDDTNSNVYIDCEPFQTEDVTTGSVTSPVYISTMEWHSGSTDKVMGKHDGSYLSNTSSKMPYRVQGREYAVGGYVVASNTVMVFKSDYSKDVYVTPKGVAHSTSETTIKSTYKYIGNISASADGLGKDWSIGDITVDTETGGFAPTAIGSSTSTGWADNVWAGGTSTSGTREYLMCGALWSGAAAGSVLVHCGLALSSAYWYCVGAD